MTHFGTSAKFIDALAKVGLRPAKTHQLAALRTMLSTGSPLAPEGFDYVYAHVKKDLCLSSISGGTDLVACFAGGAPILPVWRGELQCRMLGMKVEVFDDEGRPLRGREGRARLHGALPDDAARLLERSRRHEVPRRLLREIPERLAPRRLERGHAPRRHGDLRALGRGAQSRRRAHRHGRDLPPGRAAGRGGGVDRHRPGLAGRRARGALREAARRARARRRAGEEDQGHDPQQHHAAPRAGGGGCRWPTSRAPSRTRSSSSPCARWCTGSR